MVRMTASRAKMLRRTKYLRDVDLGCSLCIAATAVSDRVAAFLDVSSLNLAVLRRRLFFLQLFGPADARKTDQALVLVDESPLEGKRIFGK